METEMEQEIAAALEKIRETAALAKQKPTTQPLLSESEQKAKRDTWQERWLRLNLHCPSLRRMANAVYMFCAEYAQRPGVGRRLVVYGANGSGKSHTALAVAKWAELNAVKFPIVASSNDCGYRIPDVSYLKWPDVVDEMKGGEYWRVDEAKHASLVVLDDIGAEHDPSKNGTAKLYLLLEARLHKWTLITTNNPPPEWEGVFGKRIASRLLRNSELVSVEDVPDYSSL